MIHEKKNLPVYSDKQDPSEYSDPLTRERSLAPLEEPDELELAELVRRAQSFDQAAIDELYKRFRGMILNLTNTTNVQLALGEDAENIAWEYFYNFIQKPELSHRKNIAGYIKKCINLKLTTRINAEIRPWTVDSID